MSQAPWAVSTCRLRVATDRWSRVRRASLPGTRQSDLLLGLSHKRVSEVIQQPGSSLYRQSIPPAPRQPARANQCLQGVIGHRRVATHEDYKVFEPQSLGSHGHRLQNLDGMLPREKGKLSGESIIGLCDF